MNKFFLRINNTLVNIYGVTLDDKVFISGDLVLYIQNSPDKITVCEAEYVADKFYVKLLAKKIIGQKLEFDISHFDDYIEAYLNALYSYEHKKDVDYIIYLTC